MEEIELTPTSFIVLGLLDAAGEATSYELKQASASAVGDFWSLVHSQLYAEPARLVRGGYATEEREPDGRRRRRYRLSERGRRVFREWLADSRTGGYELRDPGLLKLALGADPGALAGGQLEIHRRRLAAYEQLAATSGAEDRPGRRLALEAGIGHEREYLRFWSALLARQGAD
jgi:DNA-binding PadR family transcriptional regulator